MIDLLIFLHQTTKVRMRCRLSDRQDPLVDVLLGALADGSAVLGVEPIEELHCFGDVLFRCVYGTACGLSRQRDVVDSFEVMPGGELS